MELLLLASLGLSCRSPTPPTLMDVKACPSGVQNHQRLPIFSRWKYGVIVWQFTSIRPPYWSNVGLVCPCATKTARNTEVANRSIFLNIGVLFYCPLAVKTVGALGEAVLLRSCSSRRENKRQDEKRENRCPFHDHFSGLGLP